MSLDTEHKTIQMDEGINHDQLALDALERRRAALEEVKIGSSLTSHVLICFFVYRLTMPSLAGSIFVLVSSQVSVFSLMLMISLLSTWSLL